MQAIFTFDTTHHALWAEETASDAGIPNQVVPAPPAANARCNLAIEVFPEDIGRMTAALEAAGVPFSLYEP